MAVIDFFTALKKLRNWGFSRTGPSREWVNPEIHGWDSEREAAYLYAVIETWRNDLIDLQQENDLQGIAEAEYWIEWAERRIRYLESKT